MQGLPLVGGAIASRVKSSPAPWIGTLVGLLVVFRLRRRRRRG
jgi:MYXO-CTERM domain-containing protein